MTSIPVPAAIVALVALVAACAGAASDAQTAIVIDGDRATVRGVVQENVKRCVADGPCYLVLGASDGFAVRVYYHYGEHPPCTDRAAVDTGAGVEAGDTIEATGRHSAANRVHAVDVCCSDCRLAVTRRR